MQTGRRSDDLAEQIDAALELAAEASRLGYHSIWGNDHMTTQNYVRAEFPVPPRFWEPLVTYAFLAAHTKTLRFGTGVLPQPKSVVQHDDQVYVAALSGTVSDVTNAAAQPPEESS